MAVSNIRASREAFNAKVQRKKGQIYRIHRRKYADALFYVSQKSVESSAYGAADADLRI